MKKCNYRFCQKIIDTKIRSRNYCDNKCYYLEKKQRQRDQYYKRKKQNKLSIALFGISIVLLLLLFLKLIK